MSFLRRDLDRLTAYVPGEQPQEVGWIKLNTNENPYPPSPHVLEAVKRAADARLNVYPDPLATRFRQLVAERFDVAPESVLPANGSDENLTILMRTFVEPGEVIAYPYPSYVLYETLAAIQGASVQRLRLNDDWTWDADVIATGLSVAKLAFIPNPNSPSGNVWSPAEIGRLIPPHGLLVLDGAYADFTNDEGDRRLFAESDGRVLLTRTLSKSFSLAGIRLGFVIADPKWITAMSKVKDSYNCNTLSLAAGCAAIEDWDWMQSNVAKIVATRRRFVDAVRSLGYAAVESEANFVWVTHPSGQHSRIYEQLRDRQILVRYLRFPVTDGGRNLIDGLRVTVGTDEQIDTLVAALSDITNGLTG